MQSSKSKLVSTRRSTVLILPVQLGFPGVTISVRIHCLFAYLHGILNYLLIDKSPLYFTSEKLELQLTSVNISKTLTNMNNNFE